MQQNKYRTAQYCCAVLFCCLQLSAVSRYACFAVFHRPGKGAFAPASMQLSTPAHRCVPARLFFAKNEKFVIRAETSLRFDGFTVST